MERYKDNIDEFFRTSLNSFDDTPSDGVWENIDTRLTAEVTIWSTIMSFFTKYIWVLLIGSTLVGYHMYTLHNYERLENKMSLLDTNYSNLKQEYLSIQSDYKKLEAKNTATVNALQQVELESENQQAELLSFTQKFVRLQTESRKFKNELNNVLANAGRQNSGGDIYDSSNIKYPNNEFGSYINKKDNSNISLYDLEQISNGKDDNPSQVSTNQINESTSLFAQDGNETQEDRMLNLASIRDGWDWSKGGDKNRESILNQIRKEMKLINIDAKRSEFRGFRYRYGLNYSSVHVITDSNDKSNVGISLGLTHELGLTNKWALTNTLSFKMTNYEIENGTNMLTSQDLSTLPGGTNYQEPIKSVKVNNQYADFNIGLSRRFAVGDGGSSISINPTVGWQFYFPQEYFYTFVSGEKSLFDERRFIGYFGTTKLLIAYERPLNDGLTFQFGMYGEKSLIAQGKEEKHRHNIGISGSLFFGN